MMKTNKRNWAGILMAANLMAFTPGGALAADCTCDQQCQEDCSKGKSENCKCKECDCAKGHCSHGKCSHKPKKS